MQLFCTLSILKRKLYVSFVFLNISNCAFMLRFISEHSLRSMLPRDILSQVVGWVGTSSILLRNHCFTRPVNTPAHLYRSMP